MRPPSGQSRMDIQEEKRRERPSHHIGQDTRARVKVANKPYKSLAREVVTGATESGPKIKVAAFLLVEERPSMFLDFRVGWIYLNFKVPSSGLGDFQSILAHVTRCRLVSWCVSKWVGKQG